MAFQEPHTIAGLIPKLFGAKIVFQGAIWFWGMTPKAHGAKAQGGPYDFKTDPKMG